MNALACLICVALLDAPGSFSEPAVTRIDGPIARAAQRVVIQLTDADRIRLEAERRERASREARRLDHALWTYIATAGADWAVTAACTEGRCDDRTHVGLFLHGVEPEAAIPIGLAIDAVIAVGLRKYVAEDYPRFAEVALYVLSGARVVVATNKVTELRRR